MLARSCVKERGGLQHSKSFYIESTCARLASSNEPLDAKKGDVPWMANDDRHASSAVTDKGKTVAKYQRQAENIDGEGRSERRRRKRRDFCLGRGWQKKRSAVRGPQTGLARPGPNFPHIYYRARLAPRSTQKGVKGR